MAVTVERGHRDRSPGLGGGCGLWGVGLGGREPDISASSIFGFWLLVGAVSVTLPNETPVRVSLSFFFYYSYYYCGSSVWPTATNEIRSRRERLKKKKRL